jgi:pyruvate/2-oxoglutarate dehydrogenase complex dihydrolipoamide acyltransferase (E2) component
MPHEILMPELGESVHEGTVTRWLKAVGDFVEEDEPVVEIMTDKVNTELQAPASGYLSKILIQEGEPVKVFAVMGLIDEQKPSESESSAPADSGPTQKEEAQAPAPVEQSKEISKEDQQFANMISNGGEKKWFSPVVRAIAKDQGISFDELAMIQGSGSRGRVTKNDLENYLKSRTGAPVAATGTQPQPTAASFAETARTPQVSTGPDRETTPLVGMRKMIADAMVRAASVPTVSTVIEVDVTAMVRFREANKESFQKQYGVKLTYTPFFIRAITDSLLEFPMLNASLSADAQLTTNKAINMGVAVSLGEKGEGGLIVPVIRNCQNLALVDIAKELESIARRARSSSLSTADVQEGTFTLTNPGSYGALLGTPMINYPQAAILGTYTIQKVPKIVDDMIGIRSVMYMVLTYDHRIVDGLLAGRFLQSLKKRIEQFDFFK